MGLPYEAVLADQTPVAAGRYRAMACARQLYVFSQSDVDADIAQTHRLFESLIRYFGAGDQGDWIYSIDEAGRPLDVRRDLYTYAFIIFACTAYAKRFASERARDIVLATTRRIDQSFLRPDGLYHAALLAISNEADGPPAQNPIMHLTEAYLAARAFFLPDCAEIAGSYEGRLHAIADAVESAFVVTTNGCVAEFVVGEPDNRIEPGHQFEWYALLNMHPEVFQRTGLWTAVPSALDFARRVGVARSTHGVAAAVGLDGEPIDDSQRLWAQTEWIRVLALTRDPALQDALGCFIERFLHAAGWNEVISADGRLLRADLPSTTSYHMLTAYESLLMVTTLPTD